MTTASGGSSSGGRGGALPVDLVAAYSFDEGAGTTLFDATSYHNDGTIVGAVWVPGKTGGALEFDGIDDEARIPSNSSWEVDGWMQYTLEAWINVLVPGTYRGAIAIGSWAQQAISIRVDEGRWLFYVDTVGGANDWKCGAASPVEPYLSNPDGQFHHVAAVLDAALGKCSLYVDGGLVGWDTYVDGTTSFRGADLILGGYDGSNRLACQVDDMRLYKRPLSQAEVLADMMQPVSP
jgi:hypothetical protein